MENPSAVHSNQRETNTHGPNANRGPTSDKQPVSVDNEALENTSDSLDAADLPQTKDSPLTDIGTSPPPFNLQTLDDTRSHSKDSYESSELSDLGVEESEAETDKMDFLDDDSNSALGEKVSDLQALSHLTELARLQEVDSDDSDDDIYVKQLRPSASPVVSHSRSGSSELPISAGSKRSLDNSDAVSLAKRLTPAANGDAPEKKASIPPTSISSDLSNSPEPNAANGSNAAEDSDDSDSNDGSDPDGVAEGSVLAGDQAEADGRTSAEKDDDSGSGEEEGDGDGDVDAVEADVEDTVKQEELDEQREQSEAEAEDARRQNGELAETGEEDGDSGEFENGSGDYDLDLDEHRKLAVDELILIETDFAHLRDKLFHDKLGFLEHELQLCLDGSHPELLEIYYKVNEYYQDSMKLANSTLNYSLKCINNETIATRTSIHQDFLRKLMDTKKDMVTATTSLWYKINRERNLLDQIEPEYNFSALPSDPVLTGPPIAPGGSTVGYYQENYPINKKEQKFNTLVGLVEQRNNFNHQLGILNGLQEFHGIPSAISTGLVEADDFSTQELLLRTATQDEIKDDLQAMGIY